MAGRLHSSHIGHSQQAAQAFGNEPGLLVGIPERGWAPYLIIPEGFYALVTSSGAELMTESGSHVWPAGFVAAGPFTRISHLVSKAFCVFDCPVKGCKTADNVTVSIDCSVVFRIMGDASKGEDPELVRTFVHQVTPGGLEQQLRDAMAEEIRTLARSLSHDDVFTCRSAHPASVATLAVPAGGGGGGRLGGGEDAATGAGLELTAKGKLEAPSVTSALHQIPEAPLLRAITGQEAKDLVGAEVTAEMQRRLNRTFMPQGVAIHDIMITDVSLPKEIFDQMANKTLVRSKQEYEVMEQTFEMLSIKQKNEKGKLTLANTELQHIAETEGQRDVQAARSALNERKADREKAFNDFVQGTVTAEAKIHAAAAEETTKLDFQKTQVLQTSKLTANETAAQIAADTAAQIRELSAEAQLKVATLEGEAKKALAQAEFDANKFVAKSREYSLRAKQLDVYRALAENREVVLSSSADKDFNMLLLADNVLAHKGENGEKGHAGLVAELNMLRLASTAYGLRSDTYIPAAAGEGSIVPTPRR
jgi:regulator of protease activity HflC (stomatin/prohibitin superfamily)